ncbi:MAG TPA: hypothetical protein ENN56_00740 [Firmicutes bacterium]|nr:hypothetical protein [Bacillota bacterium]
MIPFPSKPHQVDAKIVEWRDIAGDSLRADVLETFSGHQIHALTLTNPHVPRDCKRALYVSQPHAHEPGATAGMVDVIEQLVRAFHLGGSPTMLDRDAILDRCVLTFNPIGNPQGRSRAPVDVWTGNDYTNAEFWCWMRGEHPDKPEEMWERYDRYDDRSLRTPERPGIVYEQIDEHVWVEPNRDHGSSYFRLFARMDGVYRYDRWLDLHQQEFVNSSYRSEIVLPIQATLDGQPQAIRDEINGWGQEIVAAWSAAGFDPMPQPRALPYSGQQAEYFVRTWGTLHQRMPIIFTEIKNNAPDAPPDFQIHSQAIAIETTIARMMRDLSTTQS